MSRLKVMTIVGTRPEVIKMSEVIKKFDRYFDHILVHTGQNYDYSLNKVFFDDLGIREPDYYLDVAGDNVGHTMGNVLANSYDVMLKIMPDAVIVLGDTNSCLSVLSAKRLKIPVFHMEAGNRCKDENLPEEVIRRIVDVTSDVNLCYSEHARRYILDSGVKPEYTHVVGSPMREVLKVNREKIDSSDILSELELREGGFILLSAHREENIDIESNFFALMGAVNAMAEHYDMPILYSCHPRSKKYIDQRGFVFDSRVIKHEPLGFFDYIKLQKSAFCVVSDSGTLPEESACLGFPSVSIRTSTERPEAMENGVFLVGSLTSERIMQAVDMAVELNREDCKPADVPCYLDDNVSTKILKIVQSYAGIIDSMVWRKVQ